MLLSSGAETGRTPGRKRRVKKSSHDVNPKCGNKGLQINIDSKLHRGVRLVDVEVRIAARAGGPSQPVCDSLSTDADAGDERYAAQTSRTFLICALSFAERNAVFPAGVDIGQSRRAFKGRPMSSESANSGARFIMSLMRRNRCL